MEHTKVAILDDRLMLLMMYRLLLIVDTARSWVRQAKCFWKKLKHWMNVVRAWQQNLRDSPTANGGAEKPLPSVDTGDSTEEWSNAPQDLLTSMDSVGSLGSLSQSSSTSTGSLYSFPEPWYDAMMELPALNHSAPSQSPSAVWGSVGETEPDGGQDRPLQPVSGAEQEQVPGDKEDRA